MTKKDKIKVFTSNHKLYEIGYLLDLVDKAHDSCEVILEEYPIYTAGDALLSIATHLGIDVDVESIVNNSLVIGDETYNDLLKKIKEKLGTEEIENS